jgi:hypothetical protein
MIEIKQKEAKPDENGQYRPDQRFPGTVYYHAVPQTLSGKYLTGLDVYSSVITNINDSSERTKKVAEINKKRKRLEDLTGLILDQDTTEGKDYFENLMLDLANLERLDPRNPFDEIQIAVINENISNPEFPIARNLDIVRNDQIGFKEFYIVNEEAELESAVTITKLKAKAQAKLMDLEENDEYSLRRVAKIILPMSVPVTTKTSKSFIFKKLAEYLDLTLFPDNTMTLEKANKEFLRVANLPKEDLDIQATANSAIALNIISKRFDDGKYYNRQSGFVYGLKVEDIYEKLKDLSNQDELGSGLDSDSPHSLKAQIKQKENL